MIGKNFEYKGLSIPYTTAEGRAQNWYADIIWTRQNVNTFTTTRQDYHGSTTSPTLSASRRIRIEGEIWGSKSERGAIKNTISDTFTLESYPGLDSGFNRLNFTDDDGTDWFINAKVYNPPEYENERGEMITNFDIVLFAQDPRIYSQVLQEATGIYGLYGGSTLPMTLPQQLDSAVNQIEVQNLGNFAAPATITVKAETREIINPKIMDLTSGRYWELDYTMAAGESFVLDTQARTATIDGVNALDKRAAGSQWLFVNSGTSYFALIGDNFDWDNQDSATIKINYRHTKI